MEEFRIAAVRSYTATLRREQEWKTALYTKKDVEIAVVEITDENGLSGYGNIPSMLLEGESGESAQVLLHKVLKPIIMSKDMPGVQPLIDEMDIRLPHNLQLKFAIESALMDLRGKQLGVPVYDLIGGLSRREVPVMRIIGLEAPGKAVEKTLKWIESGYKHFKIKVGVDEDRDVAAVKALRDAVGKDIIISADANRSWNPMQAVRVINKLEKAGLDGIEQPVGPRDNIRGLAFVRQHVSIPVMADESVLTPTDAMRLIEAEAMDVACLKLWKVGGFTKARQIATLCQVNGIGCHVGTTPGSMLLEAAQLLFCASTPELVFGAEIGEFDTFTEDPFTGLETKDGCLQLSGKPGLGVEANLADAREFII